MKIELLPGERWWTGRVMDGTRMPVKAGDEYALDLRRITPNQGAPLWLSSKGRWLWSDGPFTASVRGGAIETEDGVHLEQGCGDLRGAQQAAAKARQRYHGQMPDARCFSAPIYGNWIEMGTDATQERVLAYARDIVRHGMKPGLMIIDDNWTFRYGEWRFDGGHYPDPKAMVDELHRMGFAVMLWLVPYVCAAGEPFLTLAKRGLLVRDESGRPMLFDWWDGTSCLLDMSSPEARAYLTDQLDELRAKYGVDGFKFDAGNPLLPMPGAVTHHPLAPCEDCRLYAELGLRYPLAEFREGWDMGGAPLMMRQQDKPHDWEEGLGLLIPNGIAQSLLGYYYHCPDMVGGGEINPIDGGTAIDQELFVRFAQASALFPIVQFSRAPYKALDESHFRLVLAALDEREKRLPLIERLARAAAEHDEPILTPLCYFAPNEGLEDVSDEFALGRDVIVAPVLQKGQTRKAFRLPAGTWRDWRGGTHVVSAGAAVTLPVSLADLPVFERAQP